MAINKVNYAGETLIDLTEDTVDSDTLLAGVTAHNKAGVLITGTHPGGTVKSVNGVEPDNDGNVELTASDVGADNVDVSIGTNGNWYIGSTDTGKPSRGDSGVYVGTEEPETATVWINPDGDEYSHFATKEYVDAAIANLSGTGGSSGTGSPGTPGFSPTISVSKAGKVTTISITDVNGTKTATIVDGNDGSTPVKGVDYFDGINGTNGTNGADGVTPTIGSNGNWYLGSTDTGKPSRGAAGTNGTNGTNGYTPVKGVDYFDGAKGEDGHTPVKGTDYWTSEDRQSMVNDVLAALPIYAGGVR